VSTRANAVTASVRTMTESQWREAKRAHERIIDEWAAPRLARRQRNEKHPVDDFLWQYYPTRPAQLRQWSPGFNTVLENGDELLPQRGFVATSDGVAVSAAELPHQVESARHIGTLLAATRSRPARFGCFGLHEWAMVYGLDQAEVRHRAWPLRLPSADITAVVGELGLRCTHFDAFRFYTEDARPLNPLQLTRADQVTYEQPGCLHANMDLFKWAWQLFPLASSDLVRATRMLAVDIRTVDMQAAPYDLRALGLEPIKVETPEGRAEFAVRQQEFAARAALLRDELWSLATTIGEQD
jgi:hypothetical protein